MNALKSAAIAALLACSAEGARAQIIIDPPSNNSTVPSMIRLVGRDGGGAVDTSGTITVVVRDFANNLIAGSHVRVEFLPEAGVRLCLAQDASITAVNCTVGDPWVQGITNAQGEWSVSITGCSSAGAAVPAAIYSRIYADGVVLGFPRVAVLDLTGCDGVGANDLSAWLTDFSLGTTHPRGDYDGSGAMGANDLSLWLSAFGSAASASNCGAAACP